MTEDLKLSNTWSSAVLINTSTISQTAGATFEHVDPGAMTFFEKLHDAQALYMNSMRIPLVPMQRGQSICEAGEDALRVGQRIDFRIGAVTPQHTLSLHVSPACVKRFVLEPGHEPPGIPCSSQRLTSVAIQCSRDGKAQAEHETRTFFLDMPTTARTALAGPATIAAPPENYLFYTAVSTAVKLDNGPQLPAISLRC